MRLAGRAGPQQGAFNFGFFRKLLSEWHIWLFTVTYSLYIFSQSESKLVSGEERRFADHLEGSVIRPATIHVLLVEIL